MSNSVTSDFNTGPTGYAQSSIEDEQNISETAKKSKAVFKQRSIQDFNRDVQRLKKIKFGDKLGWDSSKYKPEIYKGHQAQEAVRWAYSWTGKIVDGLESSQIAIKWVEAYLQTTASLKEAETVKEKYNKVQNAFITLVQTYESSAKSKNNAAIVRNYKQASEQIQHLISQNEKKDLIEFDGDKLLVPEEEERTSAMNQGFKSLEKIIEDYYSTRNN